MIYTANDFTQKLLKDAEEFGKYLIEQGIEHDKTMEEYDWYEEYQAWLEETGRL